MVAVSAAEQDRELVADCQQQRLVKTGGRLVKHARYYWLMLAEGHLTRRLFGRWSGGLWPWRCQQDRGLAAGRRKLAEKAEEKKGRRRKSVPEIVGRTG